jgi:Putative lumazine-binding
MTIATATDHDAIVRIAELYIGGFNDCDIHQFREAFHDDAWMYSIHSDGAFHKTFLADVLERWTTPPAAHIVGRVLSVTQAGDAASILLGYDNLTAPDRCWVDILSLLRIDGTWKIVNKIATHASRGGWAAVQPSSSRGTESGRFNEGLERT